MVLEGYGVIFCFEVSFYLVIDVVFGLFEKGLGIWCMGFFLILL